MTKKTREYAAFISLLQRKEIADLLMQMHHE